MQIQIQPSSSSAPSAKKLQKYLDSKLLGYFIVTDTHHPDWKNNASTLVLSSDPTGRNLDFYAGLGLGEMAWCFHADEFDHMVEDYITYYRLWWD